MSDDHRRHWIPSDWLDEINPTMLESPDSFIEREPKGWALRLPDGDPDRDNEFYHSPIEPGQIVGFRWVEGHGFFKLLLAADRTWTTDITPPAAATHFHEPQFGIIGNSVEDLLTDDLDPLEPGEYEISAYTWSPEIPFRFDVDTEGNGRFIQCAEPN